MSNRLDTFVAGRLADVACWLQMPPRQWFIAALCAAVVVAGCGSPMTVDGVSILRHGLMTGSPAGLFSGRLDIHDGCVWGEAGGESMVIVWPPDARLERRDGDLVVAVNGIAIRNDDQFTMGGGQYKDVEFIRNIAGSIPDACLADLYLLGNEVKKG